MISIAKTTIYRPLSDEEIGQMVLQGCQAKDWRTVKVSKEFDPTFVRACNFSGEIRLGFFKEEMTLFGGISFHTGIYNATIHNCQIGNNVLIRNVKSYIANYEIGDRVKIENINTLAVDGITSFGNGTRVEAINEGGGREIPIFDRLSAHVAYILALYRHRVDVNSRIEHMIAKYVKYISSSRGKIGKGTSIINCDSIKDVNVGPFAKLEGVCKLYNGSLNSSVEDPIIVGDGVIMKDFIACSGSKITDATLVANCFIGQGCTLDKHYSAVHSVFFANCQGFHGESCSIFAGPFTVTHHKSTLLIAGLFSFLNAGSGSNQGNHLYKLGPIHQGVMERGAKTTSNSYLLWPSKIGPFSLVMGRHYKHSDTSMFPFSYLIENNNESLLIPGINLTSIGIIRDSQKWVKRDLRKDSNLLDYINFNLLSPFTIKKMMEGRNILISIKKELINEGENYKYENVFITPKALERGIKLYEMAIEKFIGNSIITRIQNRNIKDQSTLKDSLSMDTSVGAGSWVDMAGLIAPLEAVDQLLLDINNKEISTMEDIDLHLSAIHNNYYSYEWTWIYELIRDYYGKHPHELNTEDIIMIISKWKTSVLAIDQFLLEDVQKEFSKQKQVGYGIDGCEIIKEKDFENVRNNQSNIKNTIESIKQHMANKKQLGEEIIAKIKKIKNN